MCVKETVEPHGDLTYCQGLEFDSVALLGFLSTFENSGCVEEWQNVLRWLSSDKKITVTTSKEKIGGKFLMDCDYTLTCPKLSDQCMLLYTGRSMTCSLSFQVLYINHFAPQI